MAEGNAKRTEKEKKRFYQIAYASSQECKTILRLAKISDQMIVDLADKLSAWIYNLLKAKNPTLNSSWDPGIPGTWYTGIPVSYNGGEGGIEFGHPGLIARPLTVASSQKGLHGLFVEPKWLLTQFWPNSWLEP